MQSALVVAVLVMPLTAMSQVAVPKAILPAVTLIVDGAVRVTVAVQPTPVTVAVAPVVNRKPVGSVSVNAIPVCAGFPVALVTRKLSGVLAPAAIEVLEKFLVSVGCTGVTIAVNLFGTVSVSALLVDDVAPTKTWKPFPALLPAVAPRGIVALMTIGKPHRNGMDVLTTKGVGQVPPVGTGIAPVSGVELPLLSKSGVDPPEDRMRKIVLTGKVH